MAFRLNNAKAEPERNGNLACATGGAGFWWTRHVSIAALSSNSPKHCKSAGTFTLRQDCINLHSCGASEYDGTIFSGLPSTNEACSLEGRVERLIASDLNAAHQMLGIFISKLDDAEAQMFRLGRQSAVQRVAAFLVEMEGRLGRRGSLELPMTRRDIGDYLGLSIETVSRSITQLQRRRALARVEPRRMRLNQTTIDGMVEH